MAIRIQPFNPTYGVVAPLIQSLDSLLSLGWLIAIHSIDCRGQLLLRLDSVPAEVGEHFDEGGVGSDGAGTDEVHAVMFSRITRFVVEVVQHFDVVAEETDRGSDHGVGAFPITFADKVVDVGLRPRYGGDMGSTLVGEIEQFSAELRRDQPRGALKLPGVGRGICYGLRDGVGGEDDCSFFELRGLKIYASVADELGDGGDVTLVSKPRRSVSNGGFLALKAFDGFCHRLLVPVPTDFGLVRRHDDGENIPVTVFDHLRYDLAQVRRPVTEPGVHRDIDASFGERASQGFGLFQCEFVERRKSAEQVIVARDLFDSISFRGRRARDTFDETEGFAGTGVVFVAATGRGTSEGN